MKISRYRYFENLVKSCLKPLDYLSFFIFFNSYFNSYFNLNKFHLKFKRILFEKWN